jgi:hypothetical protein
MFTRVVEIHTRTGKARGFNTTLNEKVLPILKKQPGSTLNISTLGAVSSTTTHKIAKGQAA